jgi:uncharacterized protein
MKLSQFIIFVPDFPTKGKYVVHHVFNQATVVVGERAKKFLENIDNPNEEDEKKYADTFKELGFIVDDSFDESENFRQWRDKSRFDKSVMRATILTTYDCNFACEYCVEEGVKKPIRMDEEHCRDTVKWLKNRVEENQSKELLINFYGGEPLMNVKAVEYIAAELKDYAAAKDISLKISITTNGSLLKPDLIDKLVSLGLENVIVTIDGDREAHNLKRPFRDGRASFDVIIENILQIADKVKISVGTNVDAENLDSISRMLDYLEEKGLKDKIGLIKFNPIVHINDENGNLQPVRQEACTPLSREWNLENLIKPTWEAFLNGFKTEDEIRFTICSMDRDGTSVVIDPLGTIYTCPAFVGRDGFQAGDIYHSELSERHRELMNIEMPDECFKCAYMPVCSGGCKHVAYVRYGDMSKPICEKQYLEKAIAETLKMQILSKKMGRNR